MQKHRKPDVPWAALDQPVAHSEDWAGKWKQSRACKASVQSERRPVEISGFIYSAGQGQKQVLTEGGASRSLSCPCRTKWLKVAVPPCINRISLHPPQLVLPIGIDLGNGSRNARRHFPNHQLACFVTAKPLPRCHAWLGTPRGTAFCTLWKIMSYWLHGKKDLHLDLPVPGQQWEVVLLLLGEKNTVHDFGFVGGKLQLQSSGRVSLAIGASRLPKSSPCLSKRILSSGPLQISQWKVTKCSQ